MSASPRFAPQLLDRRTVFAHRGMSALAPENTAASLELMVDHGISWCEIDVDVLSDGTVFLMHDSTFDRTTDRCGGYGDLRWDDVKDADAGSWFSEQFRGQRLLRFDSFIELVNKFRLNCNIEIKSNEEGAQRSMMLLEGICSALDGLDSQRQVLFSSFNPLLVAKLKEMEPGLCTAWLTIPQTFGPDWRSVMEMIGADYLHPANDGLTREQVAAVRREGYGVNVWTVNSASRANELFNWGVTGIFTDYAHKLAHMEGQVC